MGGLDQYGAECFGLHSFLPQSEKVWDWKGQVFCKWSCRMLPAGGRSPNGSSVITFSGTTAHTEVSEDQHRVLLTYFFSLLMWEAICFIIACSHRQHGPDKTVLSCPVCVGGVNTIGDKTRQFCLVRVGDVNKLLHNQ